jgi:hypothetical protein
MATHSLVTMPVVNHSQRRKKCDGIACSSSARWACARCRKIVTAAMVMWVSTSVIKINCHHVVCTKPSASQRTSASCAVITKSIGESLPAERRMARL